MGEKDGPWLEISLILISRLNNRIHLKRNDPVKKTIMIIIA
jgi:hypothetical protein